MSGAAFSVLGFGFYLFAGGLLLLLAPDRVCHVLSIAGSPGPWIRITAMFFLFSAFYCWRAAKEEDLRFIRWTTRTRSTTIVFLTWFVAAGWIGPVVLVFGLLDLLATGWTLAAMHGDDARRRAVR